MRLSIWEIYHALHYDNMLPLVQSGKATIRCARLVSSSKLSDDAVYVTSADSHADDAADDVLILHRDDRIMVRGVPIEQVFNDVSDVIDMFNEWEQTIAGLVGDEHGLQNMLDASERILAAPAFVYAPDGRAFALSRNYGPEIHWHWAEIIANGGITSGRIRALRDSMNLAEVWKDSYPRIRRSVMGAHAYMHCSLKPNGYMAGHFVLFGFDKPFYRGQERVVEVLVKAMTRHMEQFYWLYNPTSQLADALAAFLEQGTFDDAEIGLLLRALQWGTDDLYRVHVIRERGSKEPVLLSQLRSDVSRTLPFAISLVLGDELFVLEHVTSADSNGDVAEGLAALLQPDLACGVSIARNGIAHCRDLARQAQHEALQCVKTGMTRSFADDNGCARIFEALGADSITALYAHPELVRLKRFDAENGTNLYESLRAYVMNAFHLSDAARYLGLHRNSLDYRLKRMREIADMSDIDELAACPDEGKLMYLMLSFGAIDASDSSI